MSRETQLSLGVTENVKSSLPDRTGVIVADRYDAAIVREAATVAMSAPARKRCTLALARRGGRRLIQLTDPEAGAFG